MARIEDGNEYDDEALQDGAGLIALVEDGAEDAAAFRRVFRAHGDVIVWSRGEVALEALAGAGPRPDELAVLVVDIGLPGMDGVDVIRAVRKLPGGTWPAVIAMSGRPDGTVAERALAAGADEFIRKPSSLAGLRAVASHLVSLTEDVPAGTSRAEV